MRLEGDTSMFIPILLNMNLELSDEEFMLKIYNDYYALVKYTIINVINDKQVTEDIIQECFISLIGKVGLLRDLEHYKLNSYILITAKRKAYDYNKSHRKKAEKELSPVTETGDEIWDFIASDALNPAEIVSWKDQHKVILNIMNQLPSKYRDTLLLKYQYHMTDQEIAAHINVKPEGIRMYIKRGREKLLKLIEESNVYEIK